MRSREFRPRVLRDWAFGRKRGGRFRRGAPPARLSERRGPSVRPGPGSAGDGGEGVPEAGVGELVGRGGADPPVAVEPELPVAVVTAVERPRRRVVAGDLLLPVDPGVEHAGG